jgi:hypothetical protein
MRNIALILGTVASLTFAMLNPALATGACSNYPSLDNCPVYGVYDYPTRGGSSYQRVYGASYAPEHAQQTRHHQGSYYPSRVACQSFRSGRSLRRAPFSST